MVHFNFDDITFPFEDDVMKTIQPDTPTPIPCFSRVIYFDKNKKKATSLNKEKLYKHFDAHPNHVTEAYDIGKHPFDSKIKPGTSWGERLLLRELLRRQNNKKQLVRLQTLKERLYPIIGLFIADKLQNPHLYNSQHQSLNQSQSNKQSNFQSNHDFWKLIISEVIKVSPNDNLQHKINDLDDFEFLQHKDNAILQIFDEAVAVEVEVINQFKDNIELRDLSVQ
jgi:hypothetical protein